MFWPKERFDMSKTFFQFAGQERRGRPSSGREGMIISNSNSKSCNMLSYDMTHILNLDGYLLWPQKIYAGENIPSPRIIEPTIHFNQKSRVCILYAKNALEKYCEKTRLE